MASSGHEGQSGATLTDYLSLAADLQLSCRCLHGVQGAQKLERKIGAEVKFLKTLAKRDLSSHTAHLQSSNLSHYAAIVHAATHLPGVTHVLKPFPCPDRADSLLVDVVAARGQAWVKVVARKGQALHLVWAGQGQFGERDMVQQIREYRRCATHHPASFRPPHVHLTFYNTLTHPMANTLREMGVGVWGHVVPVHPTVVRQLSSVSAEGDSDDNFNDCSDDGIDDDDDDDDLFEELGRLGFGNRDNDNECTNKSHGRHRDSETDVVRSASVDVRRREGSRKVETTVDDDLVVDGETDADREGDRFIFQCRLCDNEDNDLEDDGDIELEHSGVRPRFAVARGGSSARYRSHLCPVSDSDTASDEPRSVCDAVGVGAGFGDVHTSTVPEYGVVRGGAGGMSAAAGDEDNEIIATSACDNSTAIEGNNAMFVSPRHPSCHASGTAGLTSRRGAPPVGASDVTPVAMTTGRRDDVWRSRSDSWRVCESLLPCLSRLLSHPPDFTDFEVKVAGSEVNAGPEEEEEEEKVNLDITTLITLVSSVCHGAGCHFRFRDKVLDQQAAEEREKPILPELQKFLHGKRQLVCRTALADFQSILDLLGGPRERQRAAELLNAVEIVDDQVSARAACLRPKGKVKDRSKVIFGTGDALKAVTVTANSGFIRAAKNQGISFAVHLHPARALTELKEATATPL